MLEPVIALHVEAGLLIGRAFSGGDDDGEAGDLVLAHREEELRLKRRGAEDIDIAVFSFRRLQLEEVGFDRCAGGVF